MTFPIRRPDGFEAILETPQSVVIRYGTPDKPLPIKLNELRHLLTDINTNFPNVIRLEFLVYGRLLSPEIEAIVLEDSEAHITRLTSYKIVSHDKNGAFLSVFKTLAPMGVLVECSVPLDSLDGRTSVDILTLSYPLFLTLLPPTCMANWSRDYSSPTHSLGVLVHHLNDSLVSLSIPVGFMPPQEFGMVVDQCPTLSAFAIQSHVIYDYIPAESDFICLRHILQRPHSALTVLILPHQFINLATLTDISCLPNLLRFGIKFSSGSGSKMIKERRQDILVSLSRLCLFEPGEVCFPKLATMDFGMKEYPDNLIHARCRNILHWGVDII